jgi:hypothetical protein
MPESSTVTVEVYAPRTPTPKEFTWDRSLKVGEAAKEAANAFGLIGGNPTLGDKNGKPYARDKTLAEVGIKDHQHLELLDAGGGV